MTCIPLVLALLASPPDSVKTLQGVTINARQAQTGQGAQNAVRLDALYLEDHLGSNLAQTLEALPGVKASSIGAGLSRPTIRGLGHNRIVVCEDGIKHEGQQWGDDHGLEVDQFAADAVEVIKGPSALLHGSDAIGGVLAITTNRPPTSPFEASAALFCRSNNATLGLSTHAAGRRGGFFYKFRFTASNYGDYHVPTDSIEYYSYRIPLRNRSLRNTAGNERDGQLLVGWTNDETFRTDLSISTVHASSGFYADAHGLEVRLSDIDYDRSQRDIDLPCQWVDHLRVQSRTSWQLGRAWLESNLAWQHNLREELSEPLSHGYMPTPPDSLERRFDKHTLTGLLGARLPLDSHHEAAAGLSAEWQHNRRSGWGFIIPDYESAVAGLYATDRYSPTEHLTVQGGLRYDCTYLHIGPYTDWYPTPVGGGDSAFVQRSGAVSRQFRSLTWSVGADWHRGDWRLLLNLGKAFRVPIAKELGADGINYHLFRYEQGNPTLEAEKSYQLDAGAQWEHERWVVKADPYVGYFPNFIYLNPTPDYHEGLQLYTYTQTEALRYGFEAEVACQVTPRWEVALRGQYGRSRQLSGAKRGFALPFAVPPSADVDVARRYTWHGQGRVGLNLHLVARQDDIVPPEQPTPGHATLNLSASHRVAVRDGQLSMVLRLNNLLNTRYYDHTSYYRLVGIPEPGRNLTFLIKYEFKSKTQQQTL